MEQQLCDKLTVADVASSPVAENVLVPDSQTAESVQTHDTSAQFNDSSFPILELGDSGTIDSDPAIGLDMSMMAVSPVNAETADGAPTEPRHEAFAGYDANASIVEDVDEDHGDDQNADEIAAGGGSASNVSSNSSSGSIHFNLPSVGADGDLDRCSWPPPRSFRRQAAAVPRDSEEAFSVSHSFSILIDPPPMPRTEDCQDGPSSSCRVSILPSCPNGNAEQYITPNKKHHRAFHESFYYGYSQALGPRREQEDVLKIEPRCAAGTAYFAVFDGHRGVKGAEMAAERLHWYILCADDSNLEAHMLGLSGATAAPGYPSGTGAVAPTAAASSADFLQASPAALSQRQQVPILTSFGDYELCGNDDRITMLENAFIRMDGEIVKEDPCCGTTATTLFINGRNKLVCANVGDSRAMLFYRDETSGRKWLSEDHIIISDSQLETSLEPPCPASRTCRPCQSSMVTTPGSAHAAVAADEENGVIEQEAPDADDFAADDGYNHVTRIYPKRKKMNDGSSVPSPSFRLTLPSRHQNQRLQGAGFLSAAHDAARGAVSPAAGLASTDTHTVSDQQRPASVETPMFQRFACSTWPPRPHSSLSLSSTECSTPTTEQLTHMLRIQDDDVVVTAGERERAAGRRCPSAGYRSCSNPGPASASASSASAAAATEARSSDIEIARSLGDYYYNTSPRPSVFFHDIDLRTDYFIVVASDGIWNHMKEKDVEKVIRDTLADGGDPQAAAQELVQRAVTQKNGQDNASAIVIQLSPLSSPLED